jgi:tripartite-type tricarboxylate transporter receptor subunit TctC
MTVWMRKYAAACAVAVSLPAASQGVDAMQNYPTRPVRLIVPAPPGGTTDLLARLVGQRLSEALGQPVVADNRGGAGGVVAAEMLARAVPDGHTLGVVFTSLTTNASLHAKLAYDPVRDFTPITLLTTSPLVLVVNPALPVHSVKELIALSKTRPLNYGSAGNGSGGHLSGEMFRQLAGVDAQHIPYKGAGPAAADLVAGALQFQFGAQITVQGFVKAGKLRALAVTGAKRAASLPELPTMAEAGVPGFDFNNWFGLVGPAGLPRALVTRLHSEVTAILRQPETRERLLADGSEIVASTPEYFAAFLKQDVARWAKVIKAAGIRLD